MKVMVRIEMSPGKREGCGEIGRSKALCECVLYVQLKKKKAQPEHAPFQAIDILRKRTW